MANINRIRVSGTTYDIQDINAPKVIELTQAEYDALTVKDPNAFYLITDSEYNFDGYWTSAQTQNAITQSVSSKADTTAVTSVSDSLTAHTASTTVHVTSAEKTTWNNKSDFSGSYNDLTNKPTIPTVPTNVSDFTNDAGYITANDISGKQDVSGMTAYTKTSAFTAHTASTTVHVTANEKATWNAKSDFSGDYNDLSNKPTIPTSASQLTNDSGYITSSALDDYATTGDVQTATNDMATKTWVGNQGYLTEHQSLSNYYTKSETSGATQISTALATKQDTLVSGTNIKTINNTSILGSGNIDIQGGGGKAIEAGRGITITTGETADTVSFNLPIYSGTGEGSIIGGFSGNTASGKYSIAFGGRYESQYNYNYCKATNNGSVSFGGQATGEGAFTCGESTKASGRYAAAIGCYTGEASGQESFITGRNNKAKGFTTFVSGYENIGENDYEFVVGHLAKSNKANTTWGDSGNTLFSVGNGTSSSARHNAFEIRQNGDIYLNDGSKLQDTVSATAANTTALGGLSLVKLSQAEYDALATKDNNILYVIIN